MRRLCIVAQGAPMLYGYLIVALGQDREGPDPIEIVVDRRRAEAGAPPVERRRRSAVDRELETSGYVVLDENGAIVRALEPPRLEGLAAWKAQARRARNRIEAAWGSRPTLPGVTHARDGLEAARQRSLSTVTRVRDGLQSTWEALAAMAQPPAPAPPSPTPVPPASPGKTPAPRERARLSQRPGTLWMLGGAVAGAAAAALFVALVPPDSPDPVAARDAHPSATVPVATVAAVDGPRAVTSASNGSPPPADGAPAPAVVTAPPIATTSAAVATPTREVAAARSEPAPDRAAVPSREPPASGRAAAAPPETPAPSQPATRARETPASHQAAAVREAPVAPRHAAAARGEEPAARAAASARPAPAVRADERPMPTSESDAGSNGTPTVELQSDVAGRAEARIITYTARLSDARGRPVVNAEVSLHGWLPDGSDLKARLASTSTPGVYRANVPVGARTPSNLRVLVAHGGKRFEVAPQRRAL